MSTVFEGANRLRQDSVNFEAMWVMAAMAGYALAFEELVNRNESRVYQLALNLTQSQKDAEDLLLDTFTEAHDHLHEFRVGSRFCNWLVQICTKRALQKLEKRDENEAGLDKFTEPECEFVSSEMSD